MRARIAFAGAVILAAALAACGGGGGGNPPPTPVVTATPIPTQGPATTSVTLGTATSAPLPSGAGVSGTMSLPGGSGSATVTMTSTLPSPGPVAIQLQPAGIGVNATTGNTAVAYIAATATSAVIMNGIPGFTATLPTNAPAGTYFVAYYATTANASPAPQAAAWVSSTKTGVAGGPGAQITIPATATPTITLASGQTFYMAVYYGGYIPPINVFGCVGVQARPQLYLGTQAHVHPIGNGDSYPYTGTLAQSQYSIQPCPQPTATANATVAVNVSVASSGSTATETSAETDTYATNTSTVTTVANLSSSTSGSTTAFFDNSETSTDGNGNVVATTYALPLQYAQTPEAAGNTWSGHTPATVNQTLADGTTIDRSYGSGTTYYTETQTIPGGYGSNVITANTDGSGSYALGHGTKQEIDVTIGAPSGGNISVTVTPLGGTGQTIKVPSWLPASFGTSGPYTDTTTDLGTVASLPSGCTSPVTPTPTIEHVQRQITSVDTVLGYVETETVDSYDMNGSTGWFGPVCSVVSDTLNQYYNWGLTTPFLIYLSPNAQPVQTNTLTETLSLGSGYIANARGRDAVQANAAQLNARLAGIRFVRAMQRAKIVQSAVSALRTGKGGLL